jgi:drug/metabolite transporter (DMT)-like permease
MWDRQLIPFLKVFSRRLMLPWPIWTLIALVSWGLWGVLSKLLGEALSPEMGQALSTLGLVPLLVPLAITEGRTLRKASPRGLALALAGGLVTCLGNVTYYAALHHGGAAATVVALSALAPIVTLSMALMLLRERLNRMQIAGATCALVALALLNIQPDGALLSPVVAYAIPPILLFGLSGFLQKIATQHLTASQAALCYLGAFIPVALWYGLREPWPAAIAPRSWILVASLGFFLGLGNLAVIAAFGVGGKASVISPLSNLYPVISLPLLLLLGERIGPREWTGIALALVGAVGLGWDTSTPPSKDGDPA